MLEETEFDLGRELEGLVDMFSVQSINHNVETVLDLSGMNLSLGIRQLELWSKIIVISIANLFLMLISTICFVFR